MSDKQKPGPKRKSVEVSPYNGIQANHCKNPSCENFTVGYEDDPNDLNYLRSGSTQVTPPIFRDENLKLKHPALGRPNATLFIQCRKCSATLPLKNNKAINTVMGLWKYHPDTTACPNKRCNNHSTPLGQGRYKKNGKTAAGTTRWKCKLCGKSFVEKRARRAPREGEMPYRREDVVMGFVNGLPIRRMQELYNINPASIYHHLEKAYESCLRFHSKRMQKLPEVLDERGTVYFCTDRQDLLVNWTDRHKRNAVVVKAVCSVDAETGFAYRYDVGIDDHTNASFIHEKSVWAEDIDKAYIFRRYPHLFLPSDMSFERRLNGFIEQELAKAVKENPYIDDIELKYLESQLRNDVEIPSFHLTAGTGLPKNSLLIREDYQLYAHYHLLAEQFGKKVKVVNYSDQESGLRAAFMSAFGKKVKTSKADLYYIRFLKGAKREEREKAEARTNARIISVMKYFNCDRETAKLKLCEMALEGKLEPYWSLE
jgi:transposase-like protein